jgi:pimeloyl-ACP methyl ester carboxylesterase
MDELAAAGFRAVAPWLRGYAPTSKPADGDYSMSALADDAVAFVDELAGDAPAYCVGHDWGAGIAYASWKRFQRIVALAVPQNAGAGMLTNPRQLKRSWYIWFFQLPFAEAAVAANDLALIDALWADWSPGYTPEAGFMRALKDTLSTSLDAAIGYYRAMFTSQAFGGGQIEVPALYLHGADDGCLGLDAWNADAMRASFTKGVDIEVIEHAGHFLHLEQPDVVNERIVQFLSR